MREAGFGDGGGEGGSELASEGTSEIGSEVTESASGGESESPSTAQSPAPELVVTIVETSDTDESEGESQEEFPTDQPAESPVAVPEPLPDFAAASEVPETDATKDGGTEARIDESGPVEAPEQIPLEEPLDQATEADASAESASETVAPPLVEYRDADEIPGHGHARHGAQVTEEQHIERLTTGIAPDGAFARTSTSTSFHSDELELEAVNKALAVHQAAEPVDDAMLVDATGNVVLPRTDLTVQSDSPEGFGSGFAKEDGQIRPLGALNEATVVMELDPRTNKYTTPFTQYPSERDE